MKNGFNEWFNKFGIDQGMVWGILLVLGGLLFLFQSLGLFSGALGMVWNSLGILAFASGSIAFLFVFLNSPKTNWWAAIPGFMFLGLLTTAVADYFGSFAAELSGGIFLASIGLGFLAIYLFNRDLWWTIIPFGTMTTLGITTIFDELSARWEWTSFDTGSIFSIGLGLTFLLLALMPSSGESTRWAIIPAAVLLVWGVLLGTNLETLTNYIWPLALSGIGAYLVMNSRNGKSIISK